MKKTTFWLWTMAPNAMESDGFWLEYDQSKSNIEFWKLLDVEPIESSGNTVTYNLEGNKWKEIEKYEVLPVHLSLPVVGDRLKKEIENLPVSKQIDFFPVVVMHSSGAVFYKWLLRPLVAQGCIDFDDSKILSWIVPDKVVFYYESLRFLPNCLGTNQVARNAHITSQIIVSTSFKKIVEKYNTGNFTFLQDFEIPPLTMS